MPPASMQYKKIIESFSIKTSSEVEKLYIEETGKGSTTFLVAINSKLSAAVIVSDELRKEASKVISFFKEKGIRTVLATGDAENAARYVASQLGVDEVYAELRPEDKADLVDKLQSSGRRVLFAGDGVNDAPAIGRAFLGVAMGGGADISKEAGDVVLINGNLEALADLYSLSIHARKKAVQNLAWAFAYNATLIPVAAGVLYKSLGIMIRPELAAAAMILSDITVISNALTLMKWKPHSGK
ncbi:MAG: HAD-IC family P-type ATPase [Infirmifilum uzonense]|uniref:HAD-IC family P-type ATPase n=1 Tax=Infirmifilum TaxID=2856573 RepID=UPI003C78BC85